MQIAVVNDDPSLRVALRRFFRGYGFDVLTFGAGEQFLNWLGTHRPDCAIVDMSLPGVGALAVIGKLKEMGPAIPCIAVTGEDEEGARGRALGSGAAGFVTRLADGRELLRTISAVVKGGDRRSQPEDN